jgi:hypothetical protein
MVDPQATLFLRAPFDPGRVYVLVVQERLYLSSPSTLARVEILVNGVPVGELVSSQQDQVPKEYRLEVPGAVLARAPDTTITFSAVRPPLGPAPREALAMQTLVVRPVP